MTLTLGDPFLASSRLAAQLIATPEVARRWGDESACAGMSIGGLAHHLAGQVFNAIRLLRAEPAEEAPITLAEHYRRAAWLHTGLDEEDNVGIRTSADEQARGGFDALVAQVESQLTDLPGVLEVSEDHTALLIPWQGWALTAHDFLVTRLMEIVVHSDDLAVSVGLPTPQFPDNALPPVLALLTSIAVERHGQTDVVRALTRPQRAPASVAAF